MTERSRSRRPRAAAVVWASTLLFAALFALLTYNLSLAGAPVPGHGPGAPGAQGDQAARRHHDRPDTGRKHASAAARPPTRPPDRLRSRPAPPDDGRARHHLRCNGQPRPLPDRRAGAGRAARGRGRRAREALRPRVRRRALPLQAGERALRPQRRPPAPGAGLRAPAQGGGGRVGGGAQDRRPRRPDPGAGDRGGRIRRLAGRGGGRASGRGTGPGAGAASRRPGPGTEVARLRSRRGGR